MDENNTYKIEKNIPVSPDRTKYGLLKKLAEQMIVGDSVLCSKVGAAQVLISHLQKLYGKDSTIRRTTNEGVRVWRIH